MGSPSQNFWTGVRAQSPFLLGVVPFGLVSGLAAVKLGAPPLLAGCMSFIVYAGASQLAAMTLYGQGAPALVMLLAVFIVNLRFVIYSTALAPHFRGLGRGLRALLAYPLTDQTFGVATIEYARMDDAARKARASIAPSSEAAAEAAMSDASLNSQGEIDPVAGLRADPRLKAWFYAGTVAVMWPVWVVASFIGAYVGANVPESWGLDFTMPLMFTALVAPTMGRSGAIPAGIVGAAGGVVLARMPLGLGLITGAVLGIATGVIWESWRMTHALSGRGGADR